MNTIHNSIKITCGDYENTIKITFDEIQKHY